MEVTKHCSPRISYLLISKRRPCFLSESFIKFFRRELSRFEVFKKFCGCVLAIEIIEVCHSQGSKCLLCLAEIDVYKNASQVKNDIFYFFHEGKNNEAGNAKTFIFA